MPKCPKCGRERQDLDAHLANQHPPEERQGIETYPADDQNDNPEPQDGPPDPANPEAVAAADASAGTAPMGEVPVGIDDPDADQDIADNRHLGRPHEARDDNEPAGKAAL